ncbi:MAG: pentapeptide repeat-containing protein [Pyrinomonadaceae bacterium]
MKTYTAAELAEIIELHHKWLSGEGGGVRADLRYANLAYVDLRYADLRYADLMDISSLWGAVGNLSEIKSIQCDKWEVTYTEDRLQIGCQFYKIEEWWAFSDKEIALMDGSALAWWAIWKPIIRLIIETSPATPQKKAE